MLWKMVLGHSLTVSFRLAVQVFIVNLEIPVVTTSLVAITHDLNGFDKISWVVSSYLLGYVGLEPHCIHPAVMTTSHESF